MHVCVYHTCADFVRCTYIYFTRVVRKQVRVVREQVRVVRKQVRVVRE